MVTNGKQIVHLYWAASSTCNLRCAYCYVPEYNKYIAKAESELAVQRTKELISYIDDADARIGSVAFHGAETFVLTAESIVDMILLFKEAGVTEIRVQTNGTLLTQEYIDKLTEVKNILTIGFSLDGPKELNDKHRQGYDKAMEGLDRAVKAGFRTTVISVITRQTLNNIDKFDAWCREIESKVAVHSFKMVHGGDAELTKDEQELFGKWVVQHGRQKSLQGMNYFFCVNNGNSCNFFEMDLKGAVYPCNKGFSDEHILGYWDSGNLKDILVKRDNYFLDNELHEDCKICPFYRLCYGGCSLERGGLKGNRAIDCYLRKYIYQDYIDNNDDLQKIYYGDSLNSLRPVDMKHISLHGTASV